jgi:hypothetical protein
MERKAKKKQRKSAALAEQPQPVDAGAAAQVAEPRKPSSMKRRRKETAAAADAERPDQPSAPPTGKKAKGGKSIAPPSLAGLSATEQAAALLESYQAESGGSSYLEHAAFSPERLLGPLCAIGSLQQRLQAAMPAWRKTLASVPPGTPPGAPVVLVLSPSALRVCALFKHVAAQLNSAVPVAKLFSRHMKVEEQAAALAAGPVNLAIGTPARIAKLFSLGSLSVDRLSLVVFDCERDVKGRSLLTIPETRKDTWVLWRQTLEARVSSGGARVAIID